MRTPSSSDSLKFEIAQRIRASIFTGELKPGQPLRELAVARQLSVSQAVIREALSHLEQMGLVTRIPNKGSSVASPTPEEIRHRMRLRVVAEQAALVACAENMKPEDFERAEALAVAIATALQNGNHAEANKAGFEFHRLLWNRSGSAFLARMLEQICAPLFGFHDLVKQVTNATPQSAPNMQLLKALRDKNADAISAFVVDNNNNWLETRPQPEPMHSEALSAGV